MFMCPTAYVEYACDKAAVLILVAKFAQTFVHLLANDNYIYGHCFCITSCEDRVSTAKLGKSIYFIKTGQTLFAITSLTTHIQF